MKLVLFFAGICIVFSCKETENKNAVVKTSEIETKANLNIKETDFQKLTDHFSEGQLPYKDSTNFDNVDRLVNLSDKEVSLLKLKEIFPDIDSFKINKHFKISENFVSLSVTYYKGEHELFTELINYTKNGEIIDHIEIAYDEIAESAFRKESFIEKNLITISEINSFEEPVKTEKSKIIINSDGSFKTKN